MKVVMAGVGGSIEKEGSVGPTVGRQSPPTLTGKG